MDDRTIMLSRRLPGVADDHRLVSRAFPLASNPAQWPKLRQLQHTHKFELVQAAASDHEGEGVYGGRGLGGSVEGGTGGQSTPILDFSQWLKDKFSPSDFIMCKIDVETSEYALVRKMIVDGTLCHCDRLSIEWHAWLGTPANRHMREYNTPENLADSIEGDTPGCQHGECTCFVPHMNMEMPYFNCMLPRITQWLREKCPNLDGSLPLEKWF
jgi:hypothetical protein